MNIFPFLNETELQQIEYLESLIFKENGYNMKELQSFNDNESINFIIHKSNNIITGYAIIYLDVDLIEIYKLAVHPFFRNKNIGSNILWTIKQKNKRILIEVSDRDMTNAFYLKNNFIVINYRKHYYSDKSSAFIMEYNPKLTKIN